MDNENRTEEQNGSTSNGTSSVKSRAKERHRSNASSPTNTDINDPENLDYEEEEIAKMEENHATKSNHHPSEHSTNDTKLATTPQVLRSSSDLGSSRVTFIRFLPRMMMVKYRTIDRQRRSRRRRTQAMTAKWYVLRLIDKCHNQTRRFLGWSRSRGWRNSWSQRIEKQRSVIGWSIARTASKSTEYQSTFVTSSQGSLPIFSSRTLSLGTKLQIYPSNQWAYEK